MVLKEYQVTYFKTIGFFHDHLSVDLLLDSLQTAFFKISKDNAKFELESAILMHFR